MNNALHQLRFPELNQLLNPNVKFESAEVANSFLNVSRDLSPENLITELNNLLKQCLITFDKILTETPYTKLQKEHEQYFCITRYLDYPLDLLFENILQSYTKFLADYQQGSRLTPVDLGLINTGLRQLSNYLLATRT